MGQNVHAVNLPGKNDFLIHLYNNVILLLKTSFNLYFKRYSIYNVCICTSIHVKNKSILTSNVLF